MYCMCSWVTIYHNNTHYLQNIHLVAKWLSKLEKKLEMYSEGSHSAYRVYMSAEPAPTPDSHIIPQVDQDLPNTDVFYY